MTENPKGSSDVFGQKAQKRARQVAIRAFVESVAKSSRAVVLYKEGHAMIGQIVARLRQGLKNAMGPEHHLTLDIKAKNVVWDDAALADSADITGFAASLHLLGVGQVVFTDKLTDSGLEAFLRMLMWKADENTPPGELQKKAHGLKIDGLQLVSFVEFVVTEEKFHGAPGDLSEEQIAAFTAAETLPDFLHLLYAQNEPFQNTEALELTKLFEELFEHEIDLDGLESGFPWDRYDPRIRRRWDWFRDPSNKERSRLGLPSSLAFDESEDVAFHKRTQAHGGAESFEYMFGFARMVFEGAASPLLAKYAVPAYARVLRDLGFSGSLDVLLQEYELWKRLAPTPVGKATLSMLRAEVQEKVPSPALGSAFVNRFLSVDCAKECQETLETFALTLGPGFLPHLLDEVCHRQDKSERRRLVDIMVRLGERVGIVSLLEVLKSDDGQSVSAALEVLGEMPAGDGQKHFIPLLRHHDVAVRHAAIRALRSCENAAAADALADFIRGTRYSEDAKQAVTALSLMSEIGAERRLIRAYTTTKNYKIRVAIITALGGFPTMSVRNFLRPLVKRDWHERLTGMNKDLRTAAVEALRLVEDDMAGGSGGA